MRKGHFRDKRSELCLGITQALESPNLGDNFLKLLGNVKALLRGQAASLVIHSQPRW